MPKLWNSIRIEMYNKLLSKNIEEKVLYDIISHASYLGLKNIVLDNININCFSKFNFDKIISYAKKKEINIKLIFIDFIDTGLMKQYIQEYNDICFIRTQSNEGLNLFKNIIFEISTDNLNLNYEKIFIDFKNNKKKIWLEIVNYYDRNQETFWCGGERIAGNGFSINDRSRIKSIVRSAKKHNIQNFDYLLKADTYGITQNFNCKYLLLPTVKIDGSIWNCKQRPFIKPISFLDIKPREENVLTGLLINTSKNCTGCWQPELFGGITDETR